MRSTTLAMDLLSIIRSFFNYFRDVLMNLGFPLNILGSALLFLGLLMAFFGKRIHYAILFIMGGLMIGGLVFIIATFTQELYVSLIVGIIGFVIGGFIAIFLLKFFLTVVGAILGIIIGVSLFNAEGQEMLVILTVLFFSGLIPWLYDAALILSTALQGGMIVGWGLYFLGSSFGSQVPIGLTVAIFGALFQQFAGDLVDKPWNRIEKMFGGTIDSVSKRFKKPKNKDRKEALKPVKIKNGFIETLPIRRCSKCGVAVPIPHVCSKCGETFCTEHRLPENHDCKTFRRSYEV